MDSCSLPLTITALGIAIAQNLTDEELVLLATIFTQLGDTLATIAAQRACAKNIVLEPPPSL